MGLVIYRWAVSAKSLLARLEDGLQLVVLPLEYPEAVDEGAALRGGNDAGGRADKEGEAHLLLNLLDRVAQVGLGDVEVSGGLAEGAGVGDLNGVKKLFNSHRDSLAFLHLSIQVIYINQNYIFVFSLCQVIR